MTRFMFKSGRVWQVALGRHARMRSLVQNMMVHVVRGFNRLSGSLTRRSDLGVHQHSPMRSLLTQTRVAGPSGSGRLPSLLASLGGGCGGGPGRRIVRVASGGPGWPSGGRKGLWGMYLDFLDAQPLLSRSITCAVLNGLGDVFSQLFVEEHKQLDWKRTGIFTGLGLTYVGPILAVWYNILGGLVTAPGLTGVLASVGIDQFLFAPAFIASFMAVLTTIEGKPDQIMPKLKQDWPEACKVNWVLWIPAQFINFRFVPPNLRTLAVNVVALVWNVYMSYTSHKGVAAPQAPPSATPVVASHKGKK